MPAPVITQAASILCPHAAPAMPMPAGGQVLISGQPAAVLSTPTTVAGCLFTLPGPVPSPCVTVTWITGATRVLAGGQPLLIMTATGIANSAAQAPQGPASIVSAQMRVLAS
jgi:hypothetical protein